VQNCLKKIGGIEAEADETVPSPKQYGYRNKLALPVGEDENGQAVAGFYAPRSHRIIPIKSCALQSDWSGFVISTLLTFMKNGNLKGYDEKTRKGDIRQIVVRELGGKQIITVVSATRADLNPLAEMLDEKFKNYTLLLNINTATGNAIFGKEWHICRGEGFFMGEDAGIKFKAGANTFLQVDDEVRKKLYAEIVKEVKDEDTVAVDLYSGGGMLTAMLAKVCKAAYGVEIVKEAVDCANELKELNVLSEKMFNYCGAVEDKIAEVFEKTEGNKRTIVCDPPRKGMERSVVKAVLASNAEKVVLVSCNPATLARDLGLLTGSLKEVDGQLIKNADYTPSGLIGFYCIDRITPFDMFPQTKHVETLVVLSKKQAAGN
ncbi:MAG: 23S rRNA (uracil(1939)-C(5))-methyltransferase RlmD, partial [Clostridia bacterium]|nr:23S rRNA (uracil(1939)-C(5))-methyltransferase RlmD [Clostridia bacterium]